LYTELNAEGQPVAATERVTTTAFSNVFFAGTDYSTGIRIGLRTIRDRLGGGKIAFVHASEQECLFCTDPLLAAKAFVRSQGDFEMGPSIIVPQTSDARAEDVITPIITAYFQQEIDKKTADDTYSPVKWLWSANGVTSSALVGKAAAAAQAMIDRAFTEPSKGWKIRVFAGNWGISERTAEICGDPCRSGDFFYGLLPVPDYRNQPLEGMAAMLQIHDDQRALNGDSPRLYQDAQYVQGHAAVLMWRTAMEKAIAAGNSSPKGADLIAALESFQEEPLRGMTAQPITFRSDDHRPQAAENVFRVVASDPLEFYDTVSVELDDTWLGY
jgi:hypothetical protein